VSSPNKTLNVYLPSDLYAEIAGEAERTGQTKGLVARERLARKITPQTGKLIEDLFGVAEDLPPGLSAVSDKDFPAYGADDHH
jgi:hypothetical protein